MKNKIKKIIVKEIQNKTRLDIFLSENLDLNRSQIQKMIERDLILLNGKLPKKAGDGVKNGDLIEINDSNNENKNEIILEDKKNIAAQNLLVENIDIVSETADYLVINKPSGILVHPTEANEPITLVSWLLKKYPKIKKVGDSPERPGIVHRLDKEASGLLVIAKNQSMFEHLKKQFQERTVDKEYFVLVHGVVNRNNDSIDFEIDRGADGRMVARPKTDKFKLKNVNKIQEGKEALTEFVVEKRFARFTLLKVKIFTGRTNQIRVHMLAYNHPVVGDSLYFNKKLNRKRDQELGRVFLHSAKLCFNDLTEVRQCYELPLPVELADFLKNLK